MVHLSDPTDPRRLGELKIPGFSSYLHPIGDDRLLGIGSDATDTGQQLGAQAAVFDIADTTQAPGREGDLRPGQLAGGRRGPARLHLAARGPRGDHHHPARVALVDDVAARRCADGSLSTRDLGSVGGWDSRALPLDDGRVALVGDQVRIVDVA